jgi:hypothetical protein
MRQHGGHMLVRGGGFPAADAARGLDRRLPVPALPAQGGARTRRLVYNLTLM